MTVNMTTARNGRETAFSPEINETWRTAALHAALKTMSEEGNSLYTLLAFLAQHQPTYTARFFSESKKRVFEALSRIFTHLEPIVIPAWDTQNGRADDRIFGWWIGTGEEGKSFEIILGPDTYSSGEWIIAGESVDVVNHLCDRIIDDATKHTCRSLRFTNGDWEDSPQIEKEVAAVTYNDLVLAPGLLSDIRTNIDMFFGQKAIFHRLGFAWRRGVLFVGPPGTGKTMLCKAVANAHPEVRFLYVRDVGPAGSRRDVLRPIFEKARRLAPCILAIEDLDSLIHKESRTMFLNELDGFTNNDGMLIIASSNHPERIDEALLKRPSRFDRVYHIGLPESAERKEYSRRLLEKVALPLADDVDLAGLAERIAEQTAGFTPAFLKEAILSALLTVAQNGNQTLDETFGRMVLEQVQALKSYLKKADNPEAFSEMKPPASDLGFRARS